MWFWHKGEGARPRDASLRLSGTSQDLRYDLVVSPPIVTHLSRPLYSLWHCFDVIASTRVPQIEVANMISQNFNSVWLRSRAKMFLFLEVGFVRVFRENWGAVCHSLRCWVSDLKVLFDGGLMCYAYWLPFYMWWRTYYVLENCVRQLEHY